MATGQPERPDCGYGGGALVFSALLALVIAAYYWTNISRTKLFWAAFILTRPLGAVVGDFLDKPLSAGGLALSRYSASATLFAFMLTSILIFKQRAAERARSMVNVLRPGAFHMQDDSRDARRPHLGRTSRGREQVPVHPSASPHQKRRIVTRGVKAE